MTSKNKDVPWKLYIRFEDIYGFPLQLLKSGSKVAPNESHFTATVLIEGSSLQHFHAVAGAYIQLRALRAIVTSTGLQFVDLEFPVNQIYRLYPEL